MKIKIFLFIFFFFMGRAESETQIRIDVAKTYQNIDYFGASDCWSFQKIGEWDIAKREQVADLLFSPTMGIGLSAWRFNIGGGINTTTIDHPWRTVETFEISEGLYDWSRQAEERWFLHAAKERGVDEFIAFVNSPPARMTRNGYTNGTDRLGSTNLKPGYENQFARYLVDILKFFRDEEGIEFDYISPVNEPQWEWNNGCNQEGNRASNEDIIAMVNTLYAELQSQNVNTQISITESGDIKSWFQLNSSMTAKYGKKYGNYLDELIGHPEISDKISKHFGGHSYWSDRLNGQLVEDRMAARPFFSNYFAKGWKYWATEYCILDGPEGAGGNGRDLTIKSALDVARVIHYDLALLDASSWSWWTAVSPENYKDGLLYTNYKSNHASQTVIESKIFWAFGNFSRYIRPGSVRIRLTGASNKNGLLGTAYLNEDRNQLFIVFVNVAEKEIPVSFQIVGFDSGRKIDRFSPIVTSDKKEDNLRGYPSISADSTYIVPKRSVVTLVGTINDETGLETDKAHNPKTVKLLKSCPNPFNGRTSINVELDQAANIELNIYNNQGQKIKTLLSGAQAPGLLRVNWDATNDGGKRMSSGVYFCALAFAESCETIKLLLVR